MVIKLEGKFIESWAKTGQVLAKKKGEDGKNLNILFQFKGKKA